MGEHQKPNQMSRQLQMIGASSAVGDAFAWCHGVNCWYFMDQDSGRVLAEITLRPSIIAGNVGPKDDALYAVTWVVDAKLVEKPNGDFSIKAPLQEFYCTRSAALSAVEKRFVGDRPLLVS